MSTTYLTLGVTSLMVRPNIVLYLPLQIYTHGYVSLSQRLLRRNPPVDITKLMPKSKYYAKRHGYALLAPFWADSDCTQNSKTYYHEYDSSTTASSPAEKTRTDAIMNLAKQYIKKYSGDQDINPDWVLVVTWINNLPKLEYDPTRDKACYFYFAEFTIEYIHTHACTLAHTYTHKHVHVHAHTHKHVVVVRCKCNQLYKGHNYGHLLIRCAFNI